MFNLSKFFLIIPNYRITSAQTNKKNNHCLHHPQINYKLEANTDINSVMVAAPYNIVNEFLD